MSREGERAKRDWPRWVGSVKRDLGRQGCWTIEDDYAVDRANHRFVVFDGGGRHSFPRSFAIGIAIGNRKARVCIVSGGDPTRMGKMRLPTVVGNRVERVSQKHFQNMLRFTKGAMTHGKR